MGDDWRLQISLHGQGQANELTERLERLDPEHDLGTAFHDRLVVSHDGDEVFCYAGSREQAERVAELVHSLATEHGWQLETQVRRWHQTAEEWEDPDVPLPQTDSEARAEHEELMESERREGEELGYPEFEVRVEFHSHHDASKFADKLEQEGVPSVRRWKYLLIGATDEDSANALAERLRAEAGPGSTVTAEGSGKIAYDERKPNPFAFLGGLGG